jgi:hypothetical protein
MLTTYVTKENKDLLVVAVKAVVVADAAIHVAK